MVAVQAAGGIVNRRQLDEALEIGAAVTVECLRAISPRAQQRQEVGGVGVAIAIHIAVGRATIGACGNSRADVPESPDEHGSEPRTALCIL